MTTIDRIEILVCKWLIKRIKWGYGANCQEFEPECGSCKAKKVIEWLEHHIELLKW